MVKNEVSTGPGVILPESQQATTCLSFLIRHAVENKLALAAWRLPLENTIHVILSNQPVKQSRDITIEELPAGFMIAPFDVQQERIFLTADYHFTFVNEELKMADTPKASAAYIWLQNRVKKDAQTTSSATPSFYVGKINLIVQNDFKLVVQAGIEEIEKGNLEKVVPSRTKTVSLPDNFDVVKTYMKLCQRYSHAMVSLISTPETGTWLGASPELLVSIENNKFKTVALAGTLPYEEGTNLKTVAWTQKEIEEQALVERYIISCFKKIRVREYEEHGPKTFVAGNLMHLRSDFTVDMEAINFPQLGSVMLQLLHPTSAVCGMPIEPAAAFLKTHESHQRELFAGYLGPINMSNQTKLFVNLRCMQLHNGTATLYAGAGVTVDSQPESEWHETEIKMNTLSAVLNG